jgi:hypothetical protein
MQSRFVPTRTSQELFEPDFTAFSHARQHLVFLGFKTALHLASLTLVLYSFSMRHELLEELPKLPGRHEAEERDARIPGVRVSQVRVRRIEVAKENALESRAVPDRD